MGPFTKTAVCLAFLQPVWSVAVNPRAQLQAHAPFRIRAEETSCNRISYNSTSKYGRQDDYQPKVDEFCNQFAQNGTIPTEKTFYKDEIIEVKFCVSDGSMDKLNSAKEACKAQFQHILNDCDSSADNTLKWKAGGNSTKDGFKFSMEPLKLRLPVVQTPTGACTYNDTAHVIIWGRGWNGGARFKDAVDAAFPNVVTDRAWGYLNATKPGEVAEFNYGAKLPGIGENNKVPMENLIKSQIATNGVGFPCDHATGALWS